MVFLFIFRRDLRLVDNTAWHACITDAAKEGQSVFPCFIFQEKQIAPAKNPYFGKNTVEFMVRSLQDLDRVQFKEAFGETTAFRMSYYHSRADADLDILGRLRKSFLKRGDPIQAIYCNQDITPFATKRDGILRKWCDDGSIAFKPFRDYNLLDDIAEQKPYQVYGAFWKRFGSAARIRTPETLATLRKKAHHAGLRMAAVPSQPPQVRNIDRYYDSEKNPQLAVQPGRAEALRILDRIRNKEFKSYQSQREYPALDRGTTRLSAYLKYGAVSIREVYHAMRETYGRSHGLVKELFWREFYDQIAIHFPRVLQGKSLREKYDRIEWSQDTRAFQAWGQGRTGFPIVDAAMHQLNATGYMHNRMRMVVASFLVKDLFIDWRWGERYFATQLVDYYPTANNGGWTFASGSGADAQQYNRIFNPWLQSEKYDKDAVYIKRWLPELKDVPAKHLHAWYKWHSDDAYKNLHYPAPMVDHATQAAQAKKRYARVLYA